MSQRILVVDDEPQVREVIRRKLEESGYAVDEAADGHQAIRKLGEQGYDLVISDILMPERDGLEVIMYLRRSKSDVKAIAISAPGNQLFLESARALGASVVLEKPFSMEKLARAVANLVGTTSGPESS